MLQMCIALENMTRNESQVSAHRTQVLEMLEHTFISVFKADELKADTQRKRKEATALQRRTIGSSGSKDGSSGDSEEEEEEELLSYQPAMEEEKLHLARAVRLFHQNVGRTKEGQMFFTSVDYCNHAALFIHELLGSLSGNSKLWFRELQLAALQACKAVLEVIGVRNLRQCLPGVVSAATRYVSRSHLGKDPAAVRLEALHLLTITITRGLSLDTSQDQGPPSSQREWWQGTSARLTGVMHRMIKPSFLVKGGFDLPTNLTMKDMIVSVLQTEGIRYVARQSRESGLPCHPFLYELLLAYAILDNLIHLQQLDRKQKLKDDGNGTTAVIKSNQESFQYVCRKAVEELPNVELLHLATFMVRQPLLRPVFITATESDDDNEKVGPVSSLLHPCVRFVGRLVRFVQQHMSPDDLHTHRVPRPFPSGVVDECIECLAHALSELPDDNEEGEEELSAGEEVTNALLSQWEVILNDWDAYPIHPAALYVIPRLIVWQFKPIPPWWEDCEGPRPSLYPLPKDVVHSGALEQLWSMCGAPHLWNISQDEELCNYQQIHHRQVVAAVVLRVLSLIASDVIRVATAPPEGEECGNTYCLDRFNALLLYLIMEKATVPGIVREAADNCLVQIGAASHCDDLFSFYLSISQILVDEASRAMLVESLRFSAASVLRGAMDFITEHLRSQDGEVVSSSEKKNSKWFTSSSQLQLVVSERLSTSAVLTITASNVKEPYRTAFISKVADFVKNTIHAAVEGMQTAQRERHTTGVRAALTLLKDCFDTTAYLNFSTPQMPLDEDQERQTTSVNIRVSLLQQACVNAIQDILFHCSVASHPATPMMVRCVIHGLTAFLTSQESVEWMGKEVEKLQHTMRKRREERLRRKGGKQEGLEDEDEEEEEELPMPQPCGELHWTADSVIVLPRSHLKTVYRVYLSFTAMLREPIATHLTESSTPGKRRPAEKRLLELTPITPAVFSLMDGLGALLLLAEDFLSHRTVTEVLPVLLVWYERAALPRIPTHSEERLKLAVVRFSKQLVPIADRYGNGLGEALRSKTAPYFDVDTGKESQPTGPRVEEVTEDTNE